MAYLAYIVIVFTTIQLVVALINFIFKQKMKVAKQSNKLVSILIPARNEEKNIANILRDVLTQNHRNFEILVFDDQSTDRTPEIISSFVENRNNVRLIQSEGLPNGWLGKNYACHSLALEAKGDYLLFIDADVRIKKNMIKKSLRFSDKNNIDLLSVFPKQIINSWGEYATIPIMNYILLTLLPLILVKKTRLSSIVAANGQYMFFETKNYMSYLPHNVMKTDKVEDIKIARYYKKKNLKVACLASESEVRCHMYDSYGESVNGFAKNVTAFFGGSTLVAILFWAFTTLGFIPVFIIYSAKGLAIYVTAVLITHILVSIMSMQSVSRNIIYFLPQQLSLGFIIIKSIKSKLTKRHIWKGRNVLQS